MASRSNVITKPRRKPARKPSAPKLAAAVPTPVAAPGSVVQPLRVDLGCGPSKCPPGPDGVPWVGADSIGFPGVDAIVNLGRDRWPWEDGSVDEARASHMIEHLEPAERIHFVNELYRVLRPGGKCLIVCPHPSSVRAYGDLTHKWPPVCEFWLLYLNAQWRAQNAPHSDAAHLPGGYACNFNSTWGFSMRADLQTKAEAYVKYAMENYCNAREDMIATLERA